MTDITLSTTPARGTNRLAILAGVTSVYAAGAAPLFFIYTILPAMLRRAGLPAEMIGLIFIAYLPYAVRFLWAPVVDGREGSARRYTLWTLATLLPGLAASALLLPLDPARNFGAILAVAALMVVLLVTAQTAADGLLVAVLGSEGRARAATMQGLGAALGGLTLGGLLVLIGEEGWRGAITLLVGISLVLSLPSLLLLRVVGMPARDRTMTGEPERRPLRAFLASRPVLHLLAMSLFIHGGQGLIMGYLPVLQVDSGMSLPEISLVGMIGANLVGLVGAGIAGWFATRIGALNATAGVGVLSALLTLGWVAGASLMTPAISATMLSLVVMGLGFGFFVTYHALVLGICSAGRGATEAAILFSIDSVFSIIAAMAAGVLVAGAGLSALFILTAAFCLAGACFAFGRNAASAPGQS